MVFKTIETQNRHTSVGSRSSR